MLGMIAAITLASQSAVMNAERYWEVKRNAEMSCRAVARAQDGELVILGSRGRLSFGVAGARTTTTAKVIELRLDGRRQAFPATSNGSVVWENGEGLSSSSIVALRQANLLSVNLDGREAVRLDLAGSGTGPLVNDLIDCSMGKPGWWDGDQASATARKAAGNPTGDSLLPPAPPGARPGSIPMGPAGSR